MTALLARPGTDEYEAYYSTYIDKVPEGDVIDLLASQITTTLELLASVPPALEQHRYAPDKWSVREVVGHVIDAERVFSHRAFSFARSDESPLPGMDQIDYASASNAAMRPLPELAGELAAVRDSTLAMFRGLPDAAFGRSGVASGFPFTVRSFVFIIAGHEIHHCDGLSAHYLNGNT
jgi:hypothetical protein